MTDGRHNLVIHCLFYQLFFIYCIVWWCVLLLPDVAGQYFIFHLTQ